MPARNVTAQPARAHPPNRGSAGRAASRSEAVAHRRRDRAGGRSRIVLGGVSIRTYPSPDTCKESREAHDQAHVPNRPRRGRRRRPRRGDHRVRTHDGNSSPSAAQSLAAAPVQVVSSSSSRNGLTPESIYRSDAPAVVVITDTQTQVVAQTLFTPSRKEQVGALGSRGARRVAACAPQPPAWGQRSTAPTPAADYFFLTILNRTVAVFDLLSCASIAAARMVWLPNFRVARAVLPQLCSF
jgi:hypothetical protein